MDLEFLVNKDSEGLISSFSHTELTSDQFLPASCTQSQAWALVSRLFSIFCLSDFSASAFAMR